MASLPGEHVRAFVASGGSEYQLRRIPLVLPNSAVADSEQTLWAIYHCLDSDFQVIVCPSEIDITKAASELQSSRVSMLDVACSQGLPVIDSRQPAQLSTVDIAKPWGKEVWYTGIEARGVSEVVTQSVGCPLTWWLATMPAERSGLASGEAPVLLKILAPHDEPVLGDLYFELHEIKQEVYVISAISEAAWPNGEGAIRIGFHEKKRAEYASDNEFKRAYTESVNAYRQVRFEIDDWLLDNDLQAADPCDIGSVKRALEQVPDSLQRLEQQRRETMEAFTQLHPIRVGDVVVIPRNLPHSLQHGVRAVEFQTPVYERKIVSFAQRVLTQAHWDTDEAMQVTDMRDYRAAVFGKEACGNGSREKIVDFEGFTVWRYTIPAAECVRIGESSARYLLLMTLVGEVTFANCRCVSEQAALIPASLLPTEVLNESAETAIVLIAAPN